VRKLDEVKQLLQQSATSYRSLRNSGDKFDKNNSADKNDKKEDKLDKRVRFNQPDPDTEFEIDSILAKQLEEPSAQNVFSWSPDKKDTTMDEDVDRELSHLKGKHTLLQNNRTQSPFHTVADFKPEKADKVESQINERDRERKELQGVSQEVKNLKHKGKNIKLTESTNPRQVQSPLHESK